MATSITYKGSELASFSGTTKTLKTAGKYLEGDITVTASIDVNNQSKTFVPSETSTTITYDNGYTGLEKVTIFGITPTYVGSSIPRRTSSDVTSMYENITIPAGYYENSVTKTIPTGSIQISSITVNSSGLITATANGASEGYISTGDMSSSTQQLPTYGATTVVPSEVTQTLSVDQKYMTGNVTVAAITSTYVGSSVPRRNGSNVTVTNSTGKVTASSGYYASDAELQLTTQASTTITPSETTQTVSKHKWLTGDITVEAITPTYVGSSVPVNPTITASGNTVTIPSGYYDSDKTKTIATRALPSPTVSVNSSGLVTATVTLPTSGYVYSGSETTTLQLTTLSAQNVTPSNSTQTISSTGKYLTGDITIEPIPSSYIIPSGTLPITENGTHNVTSYASVNVSVSPTLQSKSAVPSESQQIIEPDDGVYGLNKVTVAAITPTYVGSGIATNPTVTVSGPTVSIPTGYYSSSQTKTVAETTVATPSIIVNATGLITASSSQGAGYVTNQTTSATYQLSTLAATTVTPNNTTQTVGAVGNYMLGAVTVQPIPSSYTIPAGTYTITSVDSTTVFNIANYESVNVNITDADVIYY